MYPCLVKGCSSHERAYLVPVGNRKFWLANLGILRVNSRHRICAKHFRDECFLNCGRLRLGSLPTENIGRKALYQPVFSKHQKRHIEQTKRMQNKDKEAERFEWNKYIIEVPWSSDNDGETIDTVDAAAYSQSQSESSLILYLQQRNNELRAEAECLRIENTRLRWANKALKRSFEIHKCLLE